MKCRRVYMQQQQQQAVPAATIGRTTRPVVLDDHLGNVPPESNSYKRQKEKIEHDHARQLPRSLQALLPTLDDAAFPTKLVEHAEFRLPYQEDSLVAHQLFVRQFLAPRSPYNSLLVHHDATANKWCAAIAVAEEWRRAKGRIIVVTSEGESFRRALFTRDMLETRGDDHVVAKRGFGFSEGLLRDVNVMNVTSTVDKAAADIYKLIEASYQVVDTWNGKADNALVIVDNVHPPPTLVSAPFTKLLLLYSFPMLRKPQEIVDLVNLMNANDQRGLIDANEVFDPHTNKFVEEHKEGGHYIQEGGHDLLKRKLNGYVSVLRSNEEALRLYPDVFAPERVFREGAPLFQTVVKLFSVQPPSISYPTLQINGIPIEGRRLRHVPLYLTALGKEQEKVYQELHKHTGPGLSLRPLLEALIMTYPSTPLQQQQPPSLMTLMEKKGKQFVHRTEQHIFAKEHLGKYSGMLSEICRIVQPHAVIVSAFFDTGLLPLALALEAHGLVEPALLLDAAAAVPLQAKKKYVFVVPPDHPYYDAGAATAEADIFLVLSTTTTMLLPPGIRQLHLLDPPESMIRVEELVSTVIFPGSHRELPVPERNVEIYLHASVSGDAEMANVYMYRIHMETAVAIGHVTRLMKEVAVDLLLTATPKDFTAQEVQLSNKKTLTWQQKGGEYSAMCDYMRTCNPVAALTTERFKAPLVETEPPEQITQRIRQLFQEKTVYGRTELLTAVQRPRLFSVEHVVTELARLVRTKSAVLYDQYGRRGYLVSHGTSYAFQPVEITDEFSGEFERTVPVETKPPVAMVLGGGGGGGVDILLAIDVATGDSQVRLHDPWYKTVRGWFNELQLVHQRTPEQIRQAVVDRAIDTLPREEQLALLTKTYGKIGEPSRIKTSLDKRFQEEGGENGNGVVVVVGTRRFQQEEGGEEKKWIWKGDAEFPKTGWWYNDGHLHWKTHRAADLPKQDLLVLLEDVLTADNFHPKRKVTAKDLAVLAEMLLRTAPP